jgi:hypothetical protein
MRQIVGRNAVQMIPTRAWPGTRILTPSLPVLCVITALSDEVVANIIRICPDFSEWNRTRKPPLPEDLACFSERSRFPEMFSTVHEGLLVATDRLPFAGCTKEEAGQPKELAMKYGIPPPPQFCEELREP